jgi:uncharacterized protein (TIGR03083 family)
MTDVTDSKEHVLGALGEEWSSIVGLMQSVSDEQWKAQSVLPGWSVQDIVAHMIGTELMLSGEKPPESTRDLKSLPHVRNDIAAANELWIDSMRAMPPNEVLDRFISVTSQRLRALDEMSQEAFDAPSWTPAGNATYGRFMQIRVYDCFLHEQDIRDTLGVAGHESGAPAETTVDEISRALGFIVGKKAAAPVGSGVTFEITGGVCRTINVQVKERAAIVDHLDSPADVTLNLQSELFIRLAGGRVDAAASLAEISVSGDADLGYNVVKALPFTI